MTTLAGKVVRITAAARGLGFDTPARPSRWMVERECRKRQSHTGCEPPSP
jgi:hypothetical protein